MVERKVRCRIGQNTYLISSDDTYLDHIGGVFEPDMCELFASLIDPGAEILDVGANIGCTSLLFSSLGSKVISVEPSPSTFRYLQKNVEAARIENIATYNLGLGTESSETTLTFAPNNRAGGFISNKVQASVGHTVESISIENGDDFVNSRVAESSLSKLDFVKIDVEGFELDVLKGLRQTLSKHQPIVVLEMNHWCLNAFQRICIPDFIDYLLENFPVVYAIDAQSRADLHDPSKRYIVMYEHILKFKYANIVVGFDDSTLRNRLNHFDPI